jgi:hypothetical protein
MANQYDVRKSILDAGLNYPINTNQMNNALAQSHMMNLAKKDLNNLKKNLNYSALNQASPYLARTNQPMQEMANVRRVQPQGYSSLGGQMSAMGLPMPTGQAGQKRTADKTPPNWKDNLLNYIVSPKGRGMAQGLLEASGYSEVPVTFGQALSMGMKRGTEAEASAAASQLAKDKFAYQKSQDLIANLLAQTGLEIEEKKIKPQDKFEQIEIEVPDGKGGTIKVQANKNLITGEVKPVMSGGGTNIYNTSGQGGWKKVNETFGTEVTNWNLNGGYTKQLENLSKIDDVIGTLKEQNVTGKFTGLVPRVIRAFINPDSVAIEDDIRSIIFQSLRETLGAQFTQKEGERLVEASFNILLGEETNIKRLERLKSTILKMAEAKEQAAKYFIANDGDMTGYEFQTSFGFNDIKDGMWKVEDYTGLNDADLIKLFQGADKNEQNFIIENAEAIGIKLDE